MAEVVAPTVETQRLVLRAHRASDLPDCLAMWSDPEVTRYIGQPSAETQSWSRILTYAGLWSLLGFGYWAVEEKESGRFAGDVGFADFRRDTIASMKGVPEAGWVLAPAFHGRGYATEAAQAIVAWADARGWPRTVCMINPGNAASIRVAEKCGYREFERGPFGDHTTVYFERSPQASSQGVARV